MKRTAYKGYIIDTDNLGRPYIYNAKSPYSEESDHILVGIDSKKQLAQIKAIIDERVATGKDARDAMVDPCGKIVVR